MNPVSIPHKDHNVDRRPRAVTPEPATCALLSAMQSRWSEQVSRPFVVGDGYPSFQWLISLFFSSSSTAAVVSQTHCCILFPPVRVCCGRRTPNAFLSSTRRLRSRTTGTRQTRAIFLGGICIGEVLPDRRRMGQGPSTYLWNSNSGTELVKII